MSERVTKSRFWEICAVFLGAECIYLALYPAILTFATEHFFGNGDSSLYVWLTWQNMRNLLSAKLSFTLPFFYPDANTLAYSDNYLLPSALSAFVYALSKNFPLSYNLPLFLAAGLNGSAVYFLALEMAGSRIGACISGLAFMCAPFFFAQLQHPQLQFAFFIPLLILCLLHVFKNRDLTRSVFLGLLLVGAFLCSVYYFYVSLLVVLVLVLILQSSAHTRLPLKAIFSILCWNIPALILLGCLAFPYWQVAKLEGTRSIGDITLALSPASFVSMPFANRAWGNSTGGWANFETHFGAGLTASVLALMGIFFSRKHGLGREVRVLLWLALPFFVLAMGPLRIGSKVSDIQPYLLLYHYLPGFSALRACGRMGIVVYLCICLLAGIGWSCAIREFRFKQTNTMGALLACALVLEMFCGFYPTFLAPQPITGVLKETLTHLQPGALIALPFPRFVRNEAEFSGRQLKYMHLFRELDLPLVNGYSGMTPKFHKMLYHRLRKFPSEGSVQRLKKIPGLRYVAYFSGFDDDLERSEFTAEITARGAEMKFLGLFDGVYLFELSQASSASSQ